MERERSGARTHEIPWREWQVDTNQIYKYTMYKTQQPELFMGSNGLVCVQHGYEYDVVGTAMTSTEVSDELHRLEEKKRGKHGAFEQQ